MHCKRVRGAGAREAASGEAKGSPGRFWGARKGHLGGFWRGERVTWGVFGGSKGSPEGFWRKRRVHFEPDNLTIGNDWGSHSHCGVDLIET